MWPHLHHLHRIISSTVVQIVHAGTIFDKRNVEVLAWSCLPAGRPVDWRVSTLSTRPMQYLTQDRYWNYCSGNTEFFPSPLNLEFACIGPTRRAVLPYPVPQFYSLLSRACDFSICLNYLDPVAEKDGICSSIPDFNHSYRTTGSGYALRCLMRWNNKGYTVIIPPKAILMLVPEEQ